MINAALLLALGCLVFGALVMLALYVHQRATNNATAVDVGWAALLGVFTLVYAIGGEGDWMRRILLVATAGLWSFRLAGHLLIFRVLRETEEDGRYQTLRKHWGDSAQFQFFFFFQTQAIAAVVLSLPFLVVAFNDTPFPSIGDILGLLTALIAVCGEGLADYQLAQFKHDPANKGKTCRQGLWRYSRHPNYFFEWLFWWSFVFMSLSSPYWAITLLGPVIMLILLFKVTGIPYTEMQAISKRGDDYRRYQETTSAFFPWFPKE